MKPFLFGERNGVHILDLDQTLPRFRAALEFVRETAGRGGKLLFVGTKRQAQAPVQLEAARAGQYYVNNRWLGGMLTNFKTVKKSIERFKELLATIGDETKTKELSKKDLAGDDPRRREVPQVARRHPRDDAPAGRDLRDRREPRGHRGQRGQATRHPDRRRRRFELQSVRHRLRDSRQRRLDPRDPALLRAAGGGLPRRRRAPQRPLAERGGRGRAGATGEEPRRPGRPPAGSWSRSRIRRGAAAAPALRTAAIGATSRPRSRRRSPRSPAEKSEQRRGAAAAAARERERPPSRRENEQWRRFRRRR